MRIFKILVEAILTLYSINIIGCCVCSPTGPRNGSRIPTPDQYQFSTETFGGNLDGFAHIGDTFESRPRPASQEILVSVSGPEPSNPVNQNNGYIYRYPNERSPAAQYRDDTNKPTGYPIQRDNNNNVNTEPPNCHNLNVKERHFKENLKPKQNSFKNTPANEPQPKGNFRDHASNPDRILFKDDIINQIPYTEDFDIRVSTIMTDYETTTYDDSDIALRVGVPEQLAASLLG